MGYQPTALCVSELTQDELSRLQFVVQRALQGNVSHFRLSETAEGLILHGEVRTYYAKQLAQHTVMQLTGIAVAANQIQVVDLSSQFHVSN